MTAPSLILLGHGSNDPTWRQVSHQIREGLLAIRPELDIQVAFLDHCTPSGVQVVNKLVSHGVEEIVFVPLLLSAAFHGPADVPTLLAQVEASFPELRVAASRPIGPEAQLLSIIDRRLRDALRLEPGRGAGRAGVRCRRQLRHPQQRARSRAGPAVGDPPPAALRDGVRHRLGPVDCRGRAHPAGQGRRHIAVGSWFLAPGLLYTRAEPSWRSRRARSRSPLRWVASPRSPRWR